MTLRIAFDLDGVLADMESELLRQAEILFGSQQAAAPSEAAPESGKVPASTARAPASGEPAPDDQPADIPPRIKLELSARQQRRLWRHIGTIDNFWESLQEIEPGVIATLAGLAADRDWEVIFLTKRPATSGATAQVQSQHWLAARGFPLPSVYVVQGSRGRIAAALGLDVVVDDRAENCLDVVADSTARAVLVWREDRKALPAAVERLGVTVVQSVAECLTALVEAGSVETRTGGVVGRVKRLLGWKQPART